MGFGKHLPDKTLAARTGRPGTPAWSTADLAAHWGITVAELNLLRRKYPGFPEAAIRHQGNYSTGRRVYYCYKDASRWHRSVCDKIQEEINALKKT